MQPWFMKLAEAIDEGAGTYQHCDDCDAAWLPPRRICPDCGGSDLSAETIPTVATVESYTEITSSMPAFADETPYTVVFGRFDEGFALAGYWLSETAVDIGDAVALDVTQHADGWMITYEAVEA